MGPVLAARGEAVTRETCGGCGRLLAGGTAGCRAEFETLLARDYEDARFFAVHKMFVDCYCLQHPDEYCVSAKSLAAHLVGLRQAIEDEASAATSSPGLRAWLDGERPLDKPALPAARGEMTLGDLAGIVDPATWRMAVQRLALSVWAAYEELHPLARTWAAEAGRAAGTR